MTNLDVDCLIERLRNDDWEAFDLLSKLGRRAVNKLIPMLNDQGIEQEFVEELLKKSCRLEDLEQLLDYPPSRIRPIIENFVPASIGWLVQLINHRPERSVQALKLLLELPLNISDPTLWSAIAACLASNDSLARQWASSFLRLAPGDSFDSIAWTLVKSSLSSEDRFLRKAAVEELTRFGNAEVRTYLMSALYDQDIDVRLSAARQLKDAREPQAIDAIFDSFLESRKADEVNVNWWYYENTYTDEFDFFLLLLELPTSHATVRLRELLATLSEADYNSVARICFALEDREFESELETVIEAATANQSTADPSILHALARAFKVGDPKLRSRALYFCCNSKCHATAILISLAYSRASESEFQPFATALEHRINQVSARFLWRLSRRVFSQNGVSAIERKIHLAALLLGEKCERHCYGPHSIRPLSPGDWDCDEYFAAFKIVEDACRSGDTTQLCRINELASELASRECETCKETLRQVLEILANCQR